MSHSVFGSNSEAKVFRRLQSRWSSHLSLYPSLPLASILELEAGDLTPRERNFFLKTSVDYTFCEANGRPVLSIEFDGLGGGFSRRGKYIPARDTSDPYRKLKLDLKLRLAEQVYYPLIVISSDETQVVEEDDCLTILDGIIGACLSSRDTPRRIRGLIEESKVRLQGLSAEDVHEVFQDIVLQAETDAEFHFDPFVREGSKYEAMCIRAGITSRHSVEWLEDPPFTRPGDMWDPEWLAAHIEALKMLRRVGCRITVHAGNVTIVHTVWMRNIEASGVPILSIVTNIAEYIAFKQASALLKKLVGENSNAP
jgi:hypothetical protein